MADEIDLVTRELRQHQAPDPGEGLAEQYRLWDPTLLGASYANDNLVVNGYRAARENLGLIGARYDPDFNSWAAVEGTPYEPYFIDRFADVENREEFELRRMRLDRELRNREIVSRADPASAFVGSAVATMTDVTALIGFSGPLRAGRLALAGGARAVGAKTAAETIARQGSTVFGRAARAAAGGAVVAVPDAAVSEYLLHQMQELRTYEESKFAVMMSPFFGAAIGGAAKGVGDAWRLRRGRRLAAEVRAGRASISDDAMLEAIGKGGEPFVPSDFADRVLDAALERADGLATEAERAALTVRVADAIQGMRAEYGRASRIYEVRFGELAGRYGETLAKQVPGLAQSVRKGAAAYERAGEADRAPVSAAEFESRVYLDGIDQGVEGATARQEAVIVSRVFASIANRAGVTVADALDEFEAWRGGRLGITRGGDSRAQGGTGGERGRFDPDTGEINIYDAAVVSTQPHEVGHLAFELMARLSRRPEATELRRDLETALDYMSEGLGQRLDLETRNNLGDADIVAALERFATGLERYLADGEAPTPELKGLFQRLAKLIGEIYKALDDLGMLTPEMRGVYDRLFDAPQSVFDRIDGEIPERQKPAVETPRTPEEEQALEDALTAQIMERQAGAAEPAPARPVASNEPGKISEAPVREVIAPSGQRVKVRDEIVELASLEQAEGVDQPRDRSRAGSSDQVSDIANNLDPARLMPTLESDRGAPIVDGAGVVLSGNGRVAALRQAKTRNPERWAAYQAAVAERGDVEGLTDPVIVSRVVDELSPDARRAFVDANNRPAVAQMSATERAALDAGAATVAMRHWNEDAPIGSPGNRVMTAKFLERLPVNERAALVDASGGLNSDGMRRIRWAVFAAAYDERKLIAAVAEDLDHPAKAIVAGMIDAAPRWAAMRQEAAAGRLSEGADLTDRLVEALRLLVNARETAAKEKRAVAVVIDESLRQRDAFSGEVKAETEALLRAFYKDEGFKRSAPAPVVAGMLRKLASEIEATQRSDGLGLVDAPALKDVIDAAGRARDELPLEAAESAGGGLWHSDGGPEWRREPLPGFELGTVRAMEASPRRFAPPKGWLNEFARAGVTKDELAWLGWEAFASRYGEQDKIPRADVEAWIAGNMPTLRERELTGPMADDLKLERSWRTLLGHRTMVFSEGGERVRFVIKRERGRFQAYHSGEPIGASTDRMDWVIENRLRENAAALVREKRNKVGGDGVYYEPQFSGVKIDGGSNYREILIRDPSLASRNTPDEQAELKYAQQMVRDLRDSVQIGERYRRRVTVETLNRDEARRREIGELDARIAELRAREKVGWSSPHFSDQEIVHIRADDRQVAGVGRVLFVHEIQSDMHQRGRRWGYDGEGRGEKAKQVLDTDEELKRLIEMDTVYDLDFVERQRFNREALARQEKIARELRFANRDDMMAAIHKEPIPRGPLENRWTDLAVKLALRKAALEGYDGVSFARADQIGPQVAGLEWESLRPHYDQRIPNFLARYAKGLGAKVERSGFMDEGLSPEDLAELRADGAPAGNALVRITPDLRARLVDRPQGLWQGAGAPRQPLEGFELGATRALAGTPRKAAQPKGWGNIFARAGVTKDELAWLGWETFKARYGEQEKIPREDVEAWVAENSPRLEERQLGGPREFSVRVTETGVNGRVSGDVLPEMHADNREVLERFLGGEPRDETARVYMLETDNGDVWAFERISDERVVGVGDDGEMLGTWDTLDLLKTSQGGRFVNGERTEYDEWRIKGGDNYREILVRDPELDWKSPHFRDQEIVHIRADDREVDGVGRVLFVNEIQSDLHQRGRLEGYREPGDADRIQAAKDKFRSIQERKQESIDAWKTRHARIKGLLETEAVGRPASHWDDVKHAMNKALRAEPGSSSATFNRLAPRVSRSIFGVATARRREIARLFDEIDQHRVKLNELEAEQDGLPVISVRPRVPDAPLAGDRWAELAVKVALRRAVIEGYDGVAFAGADQIGPIVARGKYDHLVPHYDQKIPGFLARYVKGLGASVERVKNVVGIVEGDGPLMVDGIRSRLAPADLARVRAEAEARGLEFDAIRDRLVADIAEELGIDVRDAVASENPLVRITDEMRDSLAKRPQSLWQGAGDGQPPRRRGSPEDEARAAAREVIAAMKTGARPSQAGGGRINWNDERLDGLRQGAAPRGRAGGAESTAGAMASPSPDLDLYQVPNEKQLAKMLTTSAPALAVPIMRIMKSSSAVGRQIGLGLFENFYSLQAAADGLIRPSVETHVKMQRDGFEAVKVRALRDSYIEYRREGGQARQEDFNKAVGRALRRDDVSDERDPTLAKHASAVAAHLRSEVIDPLKEQAIDVGLLPEDVEPTGAVSYFTRSWNIDALNANAKEFKARAVRHFVRGLQAARTRAKAARAEVTRLTVRLEEGQADVDVTTARVEALREEIKRLETLREDTRRREDLGEHGAENPGRRPDLPEEYVVAYSEGVRQEAQLNRAKIDERIPRLQKRLETLEKELNRQTATLSAIKGEHRKAQRSYREINKDDVVDIDDQEIQGYAEVAADAVHATLTGADFRNMSATLGLRVSTAKGPLRERTFHVDDLEFEDFLDDDVGAVLNRYIRLMATDIELQKRFGGPDMRDALRSIEEDYARLIEAVDDSARATELADERERLMDAIRMGRDFLRGDRKDWDSRFKGVNETIRNVQAWTYVVALGDVVASSVMDPLRQMQVHGVGWFLGTTFPTAIRRVADGIGSVTTGLDGATAMLREQAELAGIAEILLNSRVASLVDMDDPYTRRSALTAGIEQMSRIGSRLSGIVYWNQFGKELAVHSYLRKLGRARNRRWADLDPSMQRYLTTLKIGRTMWDRIAEQLARHGVDKSGLFDPGSHAWTDELARADFYAAMRAEADSLVVTPGLGDRPTFANDAMFRLFFTLKSFWFAAHQRAMLRGLQEDQLRYLAGSTAMASIGMFVYAYKEWSSGRETSENWGTWLAEGVDRSGALPLLMEANNMQERVTDLGVYRAMQELASVSTGAPRGTMKASRFANRNVGGAALGPAAGFAQSAVTIATDISHADLTPGTVNAARRLTPFLNTPGVKQLMHWYVLPAAKEAVKD